ncbi:MAG: RNA polymerase sigma factor [Acidimicrobiia bacterium]|nr:RNA polymerase sigma factor [Acidimicrobiia bacterium]
MRYEATIRRLDPNAFDARVRQELASALRLATVVLGSPEGADDVVQVAMERAWSAIARYDVERPFRPWFLRIVANTARNDRRRRGRQADLRLRAEREREPVETSAEDVVITDLDRRHVLAGLNRLDVDDRLVIALRYFEHLSEAEMGDVLQCAPGTVKSRLARARARLRRHLEELADG